MSSAARVATGEQGSRELDHGVVAGLRLVAERRLAGCHEGPPIAGRLSIRAAGGAAPQGRFVVPPGEPGSAWLRLDGRRLLLAGERDWGARVRRLVPYASWLQGLPLLHAAAVERRGVAVALVGASGAGKTTLARRLSGLGFRHLTDDLTPCRTRGGAPLLPRSSRVAMPLRGLVFLVRRPGPRPVVESLSAAAAVRELARHGWGDLAVPELWRAQFDFYAGLAASCTVSRLSLPDDEARIAESARAAAELLAEI